MVRLPLTIDEQVFLHNGQHHGVLSVMQLSLQGLIGVAAHPDNVLTRPMENNHQQTEKPTLDL